MEKAKFVSTQFKDGHTLFLESQELPGGLLRIAGNLSFGELVNLLFLIGEAVKGEGFKQNVAKLKKLSDDEPEKL